MTDRERWIVYPLLFISLGASLRDKLFNLTTSKRIVCEELIIVDGDGREPLARIGASPRSAGVPAYGVLEVQEARIGSITADNYSYRGIPFMPTLRAIFPGVTPADLLRALQKSAEALQQGGNSGAPAPPPADRDDDRYAPPAGSPTPSPAQAPAGDDET